MSVFIGYVTRFGTSRRLAEHLAAAAQQAGHEVTLADLAANPELPDADLTVFVGAVYSNQHDDALIRFLRTHDLSDRRTALVSVSLAAAIDGDDTAFDYVEELSRLTGFSPAHLVTAPGALHESQYDAPTRALLRVASWRVPLGISGDADLTDTARLDSETRSWWKPAR